MAYTKRNDIEVADGDIAVELDTGELVAVGCRRVPAESSLVYHARARCIEFPELCAEFRHKVPVSLVDAIGDAVLARECMRLVLGEPQTEGTDLPPWPADLKRSVNIRAVLHAAAMGGDVDAGAVL